MNKLINYIAFVIILNSFISINTQSGKIPQNKFFAISSTLSDAEIIKKNEENKKKYVNKFFIPDFKIKFHQIDKDNEKSFLAENIDNVYPNDDAKKYFNDKKGYLSLFSKENKKKLNISEITVKKKFTK